MKTYAAIVIRVDPKHSKINILTNMIHLKSTCLWCEYKNMFWSPMII